MREDTNCQRRKFDEARSLAVQRGSHEAEFSRRLLFKVFIFDQIYTYVNRYTVDKRDILIGL